MSSLPQLEAALCAAHRVRPDRLRGSRVGDLTLFRGVLMAVAIDVALTPPALCAERYGLTQAGVAAATRRARGQLAERPELRATVDRSLAPLGLRTPAFERSSAPSR